MELDAVARRVFRRFDYPLWRLTAHNPVRMLRLATPDILARALSDPQWLADYDEAIQRLDAARAAHNTWYEREFGGLSGKLIAYFSAEFALHQSLPIYAGGLGVLAGDHCKEASDLGVPLVGVGFMYPQGYFHQSVGRRLAGRDLREAGLDRHGHQTCDDAGREALRHGRAARQPHGSGCSVARSDRPGHSVPARHRPRENAPWDRDLSAAQPGDRETRVQQEIVRSASAACARSRRSA